MELFIIVLLWVCMCLCVQKHTHAIIAIQTNSIDIGDIL